MTDLAATNAPVKLGGADIGDAVASESWNYADADTQELTHGIHRYSGKFIPQIAARAIRMLTAPGEFVVDPYCGSGTTLLEAALLGRRALGVDLNPLAILIAETKTTPVSVGGLVALRRELSSRLEQVGSRHDLPLFSPPAAARAPSRAESDLRLSDPWFAKWFQRPVLEELIAIDHAIEDVADSRCRGVARVAFSDILRRSSNAHSGYPNVMFDRAAPVKPRPIGQFLKTLERVCEMVASLDAVRARWEDVEVRRGSALNLELGESTVDAVVTHPPYIGSIPYAEYGALSLKWLGHDPKELDRELTGGRRQSADVVERFREGYRGMLMESRRVLRPGRCVFLLVGNPVVKRELVDVAQMTVELARDVYLEVTARAERSGMNRRANKMGAEHIIVLKKPSRD